MQDNFLHRIREFKRSEDPSILPEIEEADRLERELLQIADQLSPVNTEKVLKEDVPLSSGFGPGSSVADSHSQSIKGEPPYVEDGNSDKNRSRTSLRQFAFLLPPTAPDPNTVVDVLLVDQPVSPLSERRRSLVISSEEKPQSNDGKDSEVIDSFVTSPSGRRRKTTPGMFLIVKDASEVVLEEKTPPVTVEEPTFGQLMKSIVSSRELLVATPESDDASEMPPPPAGETLTYISPTPPASPPLLVPCKSPTPPVADELTGTSKTEPAFCKPPLVLSPLLRSNERRKKAVLSRPSGASVKFWKDVRDNREKADQVLLLLTQAIDLQAAFRKNASRIRVRPFGITGEYLFRSKNSNKQDVMISSESPEPIIQVAPVEIPLLPQRRKFSSRYLSAILAIQRWYKRWSLRRKETLAMAAGSAEVEAVETRAVLRKRRGDRRKKEINAATDWMNISPLSPQKETS